MTLFHRHQWKIISRTWAPPSPQMLVAGTHMSEFLAERFVSGVTTFLLQCQDESCSDVKTVECLGKVEKYDAT